MGLWECLWEIILNLFIDLGRPGHYGQHHFLAGILNCENRERELCGNMHHRLSVPDWACDLTSCFEFLLL